MYSGEPAPVRPRAAWQRLLIAYTWWTRPMAPPINGPALHPAMGPRERVAHFFGSALAICPARYAASIAGAVAGTAIRRRSRSISRCRSPSSRSSRRACAARRIWRRRSCRSGGAGALRAALSTLAAGRGDRGDADRGRRSSGRWSGGMSGAREIWLVILLLGIGTHLIRLSFRADRRPALPARVLRMLPMCRSR